MKNPLCFYSLDWVQLFCHCTLTESGAEPLLPASLISPHPDRNGYHREYRLGEAIEYVRGYRWHRSVYWKEWCVAHISAVPMASNHDPRGAAVKLHNAVLYIYDWYFILLDVVDTLKWTARNITRVDLCCDFHYFLQGLLPSTFIRNYAFKKKSYLRVGRKANDFALYGHKDMYGTEYHSIRWGSRQSGVSVYLYNKTKELAAKKDKPWIRRAWAGAGLSKSKDVWRVELSITSEGCGLKRISDEVLHTLFVDDLMDSSAVASMFKTYAGKYFNFVRLVPGISKKSNLPSLPLLNTSNASVYRPHAMREVADSGRMEKIVANRLAHLREYLYTVDNILDSKAAVINHVEQTESYFRMLHSMKDSSSTSERNSSMELEKEVMRLFDVNIQADRMHRSREVSSTIDYYKFLARRYVEGLAFRQVPSTPTESEQPDQTNLPLSSTTPV